MDRYRVAQNGAHRNGLWTNVVLVAAVLLFVYLGIDDLLLVGEPAVLTKEGTGYMLTAWLATNLALGTLGSRSC